MHKMKHHFEKIEKHTEKHNVDSGPALRQETIAPCQSPSFPFRPATLDYSALFAIIQFQFPSVSRRFAPPIFAGPPNTLSVPFFAPV